MTPRLLAAKAHQFALSGAKPIHVEGITRGYCRGLFGSRSNTTIWSNCNERS